MKFLPLFEEIEQKSKKYIMFHGTRSVLPFQKFDPKMIGTGIVSNNQKYGGFFFTSEKENAEYYTEYFVIKVKINNVIPFPDKNNTSPSKILVQASKDNQSYLIHDVFDGNMYSDIIVVPISNIDDIEIINWMSVVEEDEIFNKWDNLFTHDEINGSPNKGDIDDFLFTVGLDLNYLLTIPLFKKYYNKHH